MAVMPQTRPRDAVRAEGALVSQFSERLRIWPAFFRFGLYTYPLVQYRD